MLHENKVSLFSSLIMLMSAITCSLLSWYFSNNPMINSGLLFLSGWFVRSALIKKSENWIDIIEE